MAYVDLTKAPSSLLIIGIILAMLVGRMPHDVTSKKRCLTTALMWVPIALAATVSVYLSDFPIIRIVLLIVVVGASTWVRLYGARATVMGAGSFFGFFFPLLMHLKSENLVDFWVVSAIAVGAQTLVRAFLIIDHPRSEFLTLKHEFLRVADSLLHTGMQGGSHQERVRRAQLQRLDTVARSITTWQNSHDAKTYLGCSNFHLSSLVLNARMDVEESIVKIPIPGSEQAKQLSAYESAFIAEGLYELHRILDPQTHQDHAAEASERISSLSEVSLSEAASDALGGLARAANSFVAFRNLASDSTKKFDTERLVSPTTPLAPKTSEMVKSAANTATGALAASTPPVTPKPKPPVFQRWKLWQPVSKMSLQIMAATALATVTGQAISATHWYWAVLTVFVVFVGGTTRAGVLTRASRRITGTVGGLAFGVIFVLLFHDQKIALVALTMIAAFCMMYFGPIKYSYSAFFISAMLVGLYGLSGSLDTKVVLLRIDETVLGAIIGVACAYLLFSSNTKPEVQKRYDAYFSSMKALLADADTVFSAEPGKLSPDADSDLLADVKRLDAAYEALHAFTSDIAVAFVGSQNAHNQPDLHRILVSVHLAEQFSREVLRRIATQKIDQIPTGDRQLLTQAISAVETTANSAAQILRTRIKKDNLQVLDDTKSFSFSNALTGTSPETGVLMESLHRIDWSLVQISTNNHLSERNFTREHPPTTFTAPSIQTPKG